MFYADLDDAALLAKIAQLRGAIDEIGTDRVAVIAGEGRRVEFTATRANLEQLYASLRNAVSEAKRRPTIDTSTWGPTGGSIALEIG